MKQSYEVEGVFKIAAAPHAVKVGDFLFTCGQLGRDQDGKMAEGIENQTRQALYNIKKIVESADLTLNDIVRFTIYVKNWDDVPKMNKVYLEEFFLEYRPVRSCVEVAAIGQGALLELDAVAYCK